MKTKTMKVYRVNFGTWDKKVDYTGVDSKNVLAEDAEEAIFYAKESLSKKEVKEYYIESVELVVELD